MNFLQQSFKSGNHEARMFLRYCKLNLMCQFIENKTDDSNFIHKQRAQQLGYSDSAIKIYRDQINVPSAYHRKKTKIKNLSTHEGFESSSHVEGGFLNNGYYDIANLTSSGKIIIDKAAENN